MLERLTGQRCGVALAVCVWALMALAAPAVWAQPAEEVAPPEGVTQPEGGEPPAVVEALSAAEVQAELDAVLADTLLTDAQKEQARTRYQAALASLEEARSSGEAAERSEALIASADATVSQLSRQSWKAVGVSVIDEFLPADPSMAELESALAAAQARATQLRTSIADLEAEAGVLETRSVALRESITSEQQRLAELEPESLPEDAAPAVRRAAEAALSSARLARIARAQALELELASLPQRKRINTARIGLARVQLAKVDEATQALAERTSARRRADAAAQLAQSQQQAAQLARSHPMLAAYAERTTQFSEALNETVGLAEGLVAEQTRAERRVSDFEENRESLSQIMEIGAVGEDFSELLRELRSHLPETATIRSRIARRDEAIINTRLQRLQVQERLRRLSDPETARQTAVSQWVDENPDSPALTETQLAELTKLMESRQAVLVPLGTTYSTYIERLERLNTTDRTLVEGANELSDALEERLLWLPSAAPIGPLWPGRIEAGVRWLIDADSWALAWQTLVKRAGQTSVPTVFVVLLSVGMLVLRRRLIARLEQIAEKVGQVWGDNFWLTLWALSVTLLLALPVSLLMCWAGYLLFSSSAGLFVTALGGGLLNTGILLFLLRTFQVMCKANGLIEVHFRWSDRSRVVLASNLRWLILALFPASIIVSMTELSGDIYHQNGLGRLLFLTASIAMSVFLFFVLHPKRGTVAASLKRQGFAWRTRLLWFPLLSAAPILLGIVAAVGYYETALKIQSQLFTSAWVLLVGLITYSMAMRWLVVAHRRLAVARAREQRAKQIAANEAAAAAAANPVDPMPVVTETPEIDLSSVSTQTRSLLRAVVAACFFFLFYLIWRDLIPALGVLDEVAVWSSTVQTAEGEEVTSITLWGLILAMVVTMLTAVAARNLPGVLEITALQRLSIDAGTRYAVTAISRYLIIAIGLLIAFDKIGIGWGKVQFIVAALGVGLGFGLQEIVANFVSGIIILFERPIRVGDAVTVSDLSGTIARIQIRATTIVDWDNREILVPNKSFITANVINWTLTDPITRLVIPVGIAYGSDTVLAHQIMTKAVKDNPLVLEKPASTVFFVGFGASSLDFEVRVFVKDLTQRMPVKHELHMAIEKALGEAGIEIPFPQQDIHLRSSSIPFGFSPGPIEPKSQPEASGDDAS
ncbi:MAG: mechanosensitive ion channel domain-containing protein [Phycisphaerales bacterium JB063]